MIAKKNPRRQSDRGGSASRLIGYILDAKGKGAKVLYSWATNCSVSDDLELSAIEIETTQALNTRSEADKTYHLVVSLAPGERLTEAQFRDVEERFCEALGLGEHQRIVAVHDDTKHMHMHLAISKVHPQSRRCVGQYLDYKKLMATCRELELQYGLAPGIHPERGQERAGAQAGEVHRHVRSFQTWLQENVRDSLTSFIASGTGGSERVGWQGLQDHLAGFDVEIRQRGAGFVMAHRSLKLFVKASAVDPSLSRGRLEAAFGAFDGNARSSLPAAVSYRAAPLAVSQDSSRLYEAYSQQREQASTQRAAVWAAVKEQRAEQVAEIRERYAARRLEVKLDRVIRSGRKRLVYKALAEQMKAELQAVYRPPERSVAAAPSSLKALGWRDWLRERAQSGDESALGVLRHRVRAQTEKSAAALAGEANNSIFTGIPRFISRDGAVEYKTAKGSFIDYGRVVMLKSTDPDVVKAAMVMAQAKFGASLRVEAGHEIFAAMGLGKAADEKQRETPEKKIELKKSRGIER